MVHRHLPGTGVPPDLTAKGSRDDLVAEADADQRNLRVLIRLTDVINESEYPGLILEGIVLCNMVS